jgi:hypothetical protein
VGAGHTVTALYEVVPAGVTGTVPVRGVDPLRYGGHRRERAGRARRAALRAAALQAPGEARAA